MNDNSNYNWFCYKTVLPKKEFNFVEETEKHISFYKEGQPIVILQKSVISSLYTTEILNRLQITIVEFANLLSKCKTQQ